MAGIPSSTGTAQWSSRFAFIMAAVGSSVGLGNLWRFSAEAGENGGGAFIVVYLACVVFIGIPVLMSEYIVGRGGNAASAIISVDDVSKRSGVSKGWGSFAWIGMVAAFLIVSFYCVVAAWVVMYIPKFLMGDFAGQTPEQIGQMFPTEALGREIDEDGNLAGHIMGSHLKLLGYFTFFAALTAFLVSRGVNKGIEATAKILMPLFFLLLVGLSLYSLFKGFATPVVVEGENTNGSLAALKFLFTPDFTKMNGGVAVAALGQAFFSIGIGSAIMITYGSYLPKSINIPRSAVLVALTDTFVAIAAGLAIFPIVFSNGLDVNSGAGLFFETLPIALQDAPLIGAAFFFLAFFAAITSSISLFEPSVAYVAERFDMKRGKAAAILGVLMWLIGAMCLYSIEFLTLLDEGITGPIMLPLSGFLIVLFVGYRLKKSILHEEVGIEDGDAAIDVEHYKSLPPILNPWSFQGVVVALLGLCATIFLHGAIDGGAGKFFVLITAIAAFMAWFWTFEDRSQKIAGINPTPLVKTLLFMVRYVAPLFVWLILLFGFYGKYISAA